LIGIAMPPGQAVNRRGGGDECLDDETVALLLDASLDASEEAAVRAHIDRCDACRELFAEAARSSESGLVKPTKARRIITYAPTEPGDVVARKYRVERAIGVGGMGHVFAARHIELDQLVALKVMRPEMLHDEDAMRRFAREGKAAAALHDEHAVRILDVGRIEGGVPFIVMEYLEGRDLASILERGGPLPIGEAIDYVIQACAALEEAHGLGIIHRDLKPHNLFVTTGRHGEPFVKVLDFGLAKAINNNADITSSAMTGTNVMLGSPFFMSPEQVDSRKDIDHRTDIWSLGATLYHIVTGVPPFVAPNIHLVCARILTEDFPPLARRRADAPRELEAVLRRCMARAPTARFSSVRELAAALTSVRALVDLGGAPSALPRTRHDPDALTEARDEQATQRTDFAPPDMEKTVADAGPNTPDGGPTLASRVGDEEGPTLTNPTAALPSTAPQRRVPTVPQPQARIATSPIDTVAGQPVTVTAPAAVLAPAATESLPAPTVNDSAPRLPAHARPGQRFGTMPMTPGPLARGSVPQSTMPTPPTGARLPEATKTGSRLAIVIVVLALLTIAGAIVGLRVAGVI